jgi:hypothetical protein
MQSDIQLRQSPAGPGKTVHRWEVVDREITIAARAGLAGALWQDVDERGALACGFLFGRMVNTGNGQTLQVESLMSIDLKPEPDQSQLPDLGPFAEPVQQWRATAQDSLDWVGCYVARPRFDELESTLLPALYAPLFTTNVAAVLVLVPKTSDCDCRLEVISPAIAAGVIPEFQFHLREFLDAERTLPAPNGAPLVLETPEEFYAVPAPPKVEEPAPTRLIMPLPVVREERKSSGKPPSHLRPLASTIPAPVIEPVTTPPVRRASRPWLWVALAILTAAAGIVAGRLWHVALPLIMRSTPAGTPAPSESALELQVARRGSDLELTWNRKAKVLQGEVQGVLRINDNGTRNELPLNAAQLRNGRVLYVPRSGDVEIALEVTPAGGALISDSVRVLQPGFTPTPGQAQVPATKGATSANPPPTGTAQRTMPSAIKPAPREFVLPPATRTVPNPQTVGSFRIEPATSDTNLSSLGRPLLPSSATPATPPPGTVPSITTPPAPEGRRIAATPPVPLRQFALTIPPALAARLPMETVVQVELSVDAEGRVAGMAPEPQKTPAANDLAALAATSARNWRFKPATSGGVPVASKYILTFRLKR